MIVEEITILMQCDECGDFLVDKSGELVRLLDSPYDYNKILYEAAKSGWRGRDKHYCPKCVEMIKKGNKND